tara:strand:+ start:2124 stop:3188 length:1065 start_codon:yes stop_codon:yes gene_type:complete
MLKNLIINKNLSIREALKRVELSGQRCVYISKDNKLVGSLTDGDLRKLIIKDVNLDKKITNFYNKYPKFLEKKNFTISRAKKILLKYKIETLPITEKKKIIEVITWRDIVKNKIPKLKSSIFIIAGGRGERLMPFTSILPKPLIPINGVPIIKLIINSFDANDVKEIFVSVNYKNSIIKSYLKSEIKDKKIIFLNEKKPLGTIGSIKLANEKDLSNNVIISFCDIFFQTHMKNVLDFHEKNLNDLTIVVAQKKIQIPYGVCIINKKGKFIKIDEKPTSKQFVNVGYYILNKKMFKYIPKGVKMDVTELIKKIKSGKNKVNIYPIEDESWFDVGQWSNYKSTLNNFTGFLATDEQ